MTGIGQSQRTIGSSCQTATRKTASDAAQKTTTCAALSAAGGQLPRRRPRVAGVDAGVDEPVERHRQRAGADHRHGDPDEVVRARDAVDGEEGADVRERQREDRVLDLHERREAARDRPSASSCLAVRRLLAGEELEPVHQRRPQDREAVAAAARRARRLTTSVRAADAGDPARKQRVRRLRDRVGADRLGEPGRERGRRRRASPRASRRAARSPCRPSSGRAERRPPLAHAPRRSPRARRGRRVRSTSNPSRLEQLREHVAAAGPRARPRRRRPRR